MHAPVPSAGSNNLIYQLNDPPAFTPAPFVVLPHLAGNFVDIPACG